MEKRSFRHNHPVLLGFFILGVMFLLFWGGMTFFIASLGTPSRDLFSHKPGVGVVELKGVILSAEDVLRDLRELREDSRVRAIVLRIDSPGGAVGAAQEIFQEILRTSGKKPVVASMGSVAASGGYYAALGAERIMASPGTLTGSIGVIVQFANLEELFSKIGYQSEVVKSGRLKDIGSPNRPMSEEEKAVLQELIDNVYGQFVRDTAERRNLPEGAVRELADGRIFSGEQAKKLGLIDLFGNFSDAILLGAELAGLTDESPAVIYPSRTDGSFFDLLVGEQQAASFRQILGQAHLLSYLWKAPGFVR